MGRDGAGRCRRTLTGLAGAACVGFCFYLGWNVYWLCRRVLPPSILLGLCGIPAPTTGFTRALLALRDGDVLLSLRWNPVAVPLLVLYGASLGVAGWRLVRRRRVVLPTWMAWAWGVLLVGGWVAKLASGPAWW